MPISIASVALYLLCYVYSILAMPVPANAPKIPWLLLVFSLPANTANQRVEIWHKLQRYETLDTEAVLKTSTQGLQLVRKKARRPRWLARKCLPEGLLMFSSLALHSESASYWTG
jgi:hypothetical protein